MFGYRSDIREIDGYDVVVRGGGPAWFPAALAAARRGLKVLLVEGKHQLGGVGVTGMVSHWLGGRSNDGDWVIGGIFRELAEAAWARSIAVIPDPRDYADVPYAPHGIHKGQLLAGIPFDPFAMAPFLEQTLLDAGVDIRYETLTLDAIVENGAVTRVITAGKDGLSAVGARVFIDATGDADVAARTGCRYVVGDREGRGMAISLIIHLENVVERELMEYVTTADDPRFRKKLAELRQAGVDCYNYDIIIFVKLNRDGYFMINGRALGQIDGTDPASRTRAYITERGKVDGTLELFRRYWPGTRHATLRAVASSLGVRETRRIKAIGYLSVQDVLDRRPFDDTIGYTAYGWDINRGAGEQVDPKSLPKPPAIPIPYRVMVPETVGNLICPGRAVNCERPVLGPMRVQAPIMAMGQAAGTAAAAAIADGLAFRDVDVPRLRTSLADDGAIVSR